MLKSVKQSCNVNRQRRTLRSKLFVFSIMIFYDVSSIRYLTTSKQRNCLCLYTVHIVFENTGLLKHVYVLFNSEYRSTVLMVISPLLQYSAESGSDSNFLDICTDDRPILRHLQTPLAFTSCYKVLRPLGIKVSRQVHVRINEINKLMESGLANVVLTLHGTRFGHHLFPFTRRMEWSDISAWTVTGILYA